MSFLSDKIVPKEDKYSVHSVHATPKGMQFAYKEFFLTTIKYLEEKGNDKKNHKMVSENIEKYSN